jgi:hypothetical protein
MALQLPTPAQALLQTPLNTYSPTSSPLINTTNGFTYVYDTGLGVWTAAVGSAGTVLNPATFAEAATGTSSSVYLSPETGVPKNASGMTGAALIPGGTTGQQPGSPVTGMLRYNSTTLPAFMEFWDSAAWTPVGAPPVAGLGIRITGSIVKVNIPQQTNPPATGTAAAQAEDGSLYWDDTLGALFIRYNNGGSPTWVQTTPSDGGSPIGVGQTWQDVLASRAVGVNYTNSTGRPIMVSITPASVNSQVSGFAINGVQIAYQAFVPSAGGGTAPFTYIVPDGATYQLVPISSTTLGGTSAWWELR